MGGQENEEYFVWASRIWANASTVGEFTSRRDECGDNSSTSSFVWMQSVRPTGPS